MREANRRPPSWLSPRLLHASAHCHQRIRPRQVLKQDSSTVSDWINKTMMLLPTASTFSRSKTTEPPHHRRYKTCEPSSCRVLIIRISITDQDQISSATREASILVLAALDSAINLAYLCQQQVRKRQNTTK